ncbi:hypothetical protein [Ammoniphilus sp. YIM 78166]|uniref:hypothetical protein n=1 Tax=Ammoniphilus sp. YIM 78166 TaxID=1644106 RepID=UPI00106FD8D9|nr:hypothetical protein [Ammoniphilus sp. YIM 78166]
MNHNYQTPLLLNRMISWEREFASQVKYLENPTGLFLGIDFQEKQGYFCTPVDSFPFARTGMDGIHYALLTDFGFVQTLDEAPVIRISPMDREKIRLVARNLSEFFSLHFFDELLLLNEFTSEEDYLKCKRKEEEKDLQSEWFDYARWKREKALVMNEVRDQFKLSPIVNAFQYIQEIRSERQAGVTVTTEDSLGVRSILAGKESLLASIRDLQASACSDRSLVERHAHELIRLGLVHEAESLLIRLLG